MEYDELRPISLANEFVEYAKDNKFASKFQYFVDELNKIPPEDRLKVFYNIRISDVIGINDKHVVTTCAYKCVVEIACLVIGALSPCKVPDVIGAGDGLDF